MRSLIAYVGLGLLTLTPAGAVETLLPLPSGCSWLSWDHKIIICRQMFKPGKSLCPEGFRRTCGRLPSALKEVCASDLGGFFAFTTTSPIGHVGGDPPNVVRCVDGTDGYAVTGCGSTSNSFPTATFFNGSCNGYPRAVLCGSNPMEWKCSWEGFDKVENPIPTDGILCCQ